MNRKWSLIAMPLLCYLVFGCAGSFEKERTALISANADLKKELAQKDESLKYHQKMLSEQKNEIADLEKENAVLAEKLIAVERKDLPEKSTELRKPASQGEKNIAAVKSLRIKILAGLHQMQKARLISIKLTGHGYKIARLDRAPKPFERTTVYYSAGAQKEAGIIADQMGAAATKPISWKSEFDIIIAVGK